MIVLNTKRPSTPRRRAGLVLALGIAACLAASARAGDARTPVADGLDAELICGHPALLDGDLAAHREALMVALENDPSSPLASTVAQMLWSYEPDGEWPADPNRETERLLALSRVVTDADASLWLRRIVKRDAARQRFSADPIELPDDLFADFVRSWYVVGPLGPLHDPAPQFAGAPASSPEPGGASVHPADTVLDEVYRAADGALRAWTPLARGRNQTAIRPSSRVYPVRGLTYALSHVDVPTSALDADGRAVLELRTTGPVRVWWNDALVLDEPRAVPFAAGERLLVRVAVREGWNSLLVRISTDEAGPLSARVLDASGRSVMTKSAESSASLSRTGAPGEPGVRLPEPLLGVVPGDDGAYGAALRMLRARLAGRPDVSLSIPAPEADASAPLTLAAWRLEHLRAIQLAPHLPEEIRRRRQVEVIDAMEADGTLFAEARAVRIARFLSEDRPDEALATADAWIAAAPERAWPQHARTFVLGRLDRYGVLQRQALEELLRTFPNHQTARAALVRIELDGGDDVGAFEGAWAALTGDGGLIPDGTNDDLLDIVLGALRNADPARAETLLSRARAWQAETPDAVSADGLIVRLLRVLGRDDEALALLQAETAETPEKPGPLRSLAQARLRLGDEAGAVEALTAALRIDPSDRPTLDLLEALGVEARVTRFFREFAPDAEAALDAAQGVGDTSVIEALDSGLMFYYPDGSCHARSATLSIPLDRKGAEELHSIPVVGDTQRVRIMADAGRVLEPVNVNDEWVLPALSPGDIVDRVWDDVDASLPGAPPVYKSWRFASFARAFPTSRWVVYVPDALGGRLHVHGYDGSHEEVRWEDGTVHVFVGSYPRQIEEVLRPSDDEILPIAAYGGDGSYPMQLHAWRAFVTGQSALPADLEDEVRAFANEHLVEDDDAATARAIYAALDLRLQSYEGERDAASVWQQKRGWPLFLLAALYDRAGVPYEWAVLERSISPELDPQPFFPYDGLRPLTQAVLRLGALDEAGDPIWIIPAGQPGSPFGALSSTIVGAPAFVLEPGGGERQELLPRTQAKASWNVRVEIDFEVQESGAAAVRGRIVDASPQGRVAVRQLGEMPAQQREAIARQQAAQMTGGVDIAEARLVLDGSEGEGIVILFEGTHPSFATTGAARIPFLTLNMSRNFGPAERRWPLAVRQAVRLLVSIQVDPGEHWTLGDGPKPILEAREGFELELGVTDGPTARRYTQRFEQRGMELSPDEVPAFLRKLGEIDAEFERALRLERVR